MDRKKNELDQGSSHDYRPKVFVHLARDKDPVAWAIARDAGTLVGRNDATPYGYGRAVAMGCDVAFSHSGPESLGSKMTRLGLRVALGYDVLHSRRQRDAMLVSDVVWTHTESQFLAVASTLGSRPGRPKILAQAVWLFDHWHRLSFAKRSLYKKLMRQVDVLTTLSPLNAAMARDLFPTTRVELVLFGIPSETVVPPRLRHANPTRIVSVGNDRHRDWSTLVASAELITDSTLTLLSGTAPASLVAGRPGMKIAPARTNAELDAAYADATVAVVPLQKNLHASGTTVVQEAILAGVPVVVTDAGGLRSYFHDDEVKFVPDRNPAAMAAAIVDLAADPEAAKSMAERAQRGLAARAVGADSYVKRHVTLTRELLSLKS